MIWALKQRILKIKNDEIHIFNNNLFNDSFL